MKDAADDVPLVVDVDGSLLASDLLWEGLVRVLFHRPRELPNILAALFQGRAAFKARVARIADLDLDGIPTTPAVQSLVAEAQARGRLVVLASAAHHTQVERLSNRINADLVVASTPEMNMKGQRKLDSLHQHLETFDYVGDSPDDLPLIQAARRAYLVHPGPFLRQRMSDVGGGVTIVPRTVGDRLRAWIQELRPHQWVKNGLLLLPILAAHLEFTWDLALDVLTGLVSFSLLASAIYVANDLADLASDRSHPVKKDRPIASGALSIKTAVATVPVLIASSGLLALRFPIEFMFVLGIYLLLNAAYSFGLKRMIVLDVVVLAALYTIRVMAGSALASISLTGWFLAFAVFFFLSLAVLKRVVELERLARTNTETPVSGRSYSPSDLPVLQAVGPGAGLMSGLVYCLYITGPVRELYDRPELLWVGLPLFLYWIIRVWMLALRGEVEEDPVVFVLRDRVSYAVLSAFLAVVFLAS